MLKVPLAVEARRRILNRGVIGVAPYAVATALAAVSAYATLIITAALAAYYAFPVAAGLDVGE